MKAILIPDTFDLTIKFYSGSYSTALKYEDAKISVSFGSGSSYSEQHIRVAIVSLNEWDVRIIGDNDLYDKLKSVPEKDYFNTVFQYLMSAENWVEIFYAMMDMSNSKGYKLGRLETQEKIRKELGL